MTAPRLKISALKEYCWAFRISGATSSLNEVITVRKLMKEGEDSTSGGAGQVHLFDYREHIVATPKAWEKKNINNDGLILPYQPVWLEQCFLHHDGEGCLTV